MNRDQLIRHIVPAVYPNYQFEKTAQTKTTAPVKTEQNTLLAKASEMLKRASVEMSNLREDNEKLAAENKDLKDRITSINKHAEAEKLAKMMAAKGMIKSADIDSKIEEISEFDKTAFDLFKDAIEKVNVEHTASAGVNSLGFLYGAESSNEPQPKQSSMADTCAGYAQNNY